MGDQSFPFAQGAYGPFAAPIVPDTFLPDATQGQTFYVNVAEGGADDTGSPWPKVDEAICFSTIQGAIDACVADRGDTIWIKAGAATIAPSATINFNKSGIRVFGQKMGASIRRPRVQIDCSDTTGPAFLITKRCHIRDILVQSANTTTFWQGSGGPEVVRIDNVTLSTDGQGTIIERCLIRNAARTDIVDLLVNKGAPDVEISNCIFEGHVVGSPSGVIWGGSGDTGPGGGRGGSTWVHDCHFTDVEYAWDMRGVGTENFLIRNYTGYYQVGSTWVKGIKYPAGGSSTFASNALVADNYFGLTADTSHSHTITNLELRGVIMSGNHYAAEHE